MKIILSIFVFISGLVCCNAQCPYHVVGHRGGDSYYYPENTLLSIEQGFMEGAWAVEVDPRITKDSVLMLMHDEYVSRTTNGTGLIGEMTKNQILNLDAGAWKNQSFAGLKVPTLLEAIQLAKKYDKKLYLNMKVYVPALIKKTLELSGAKPDVIILDPDDTSKVREYHTLMPQTPLVYFGNPPSDIHDTLFYLNLKKQHVIAAEVPVIDVQDTTESWVSEYRDMLHYVGLEFWTYTINGHNMFEYAKNEGVDGFETDRPAMARNFFCDNEYGGFFPEKRITGQWDFNSSNLFGTIGSQMIEIGDTSDLTQKIIIAKTSDFKIPFVNDTDATVMYVPALNPTHALRFYSNIAPNAPVSWKYCDCNLNYTIVMDILKPATTKPYIALFQTGSANTDDAELFINAFENNGVGILEQYFGSIKDNIWYRLAFAFNLENNKIDIYGDGQKWGTVNVPDKDKYRFCINNNWAIQMSHFFSDESGETDNLYVNSLQLRDYAMTAQEVASLGGASAHKIYSKINVDSSLCVSAIPNISDVNVTEGNSLKIAAQAGDTVNYRWQINQHDGLGWHAFSGSNIINTLSDTCLITNVPLTLNTAGIRCVISNDCVVYTNEALISVNTDTTSFDVLLANEQPIRVFPNPSNGVIHVHSENAISKVNVYSLEGKLIAEINAKGENSIYFNIKSGLFYIEIIGNTFVKTQLLQVF